MIAFRIDQDRQLVEATVAGTPFSQEFSDYQAALRVHPAFDPTFALLADLRAASFAKVGFLEVRQIAEGNPFGPDSPRALVVRDPGDAGLIQLFRAYSEVRHTSPVGVFGDLDAALAWIEDERGAKR
jgi:hypothetical protein